MYELKRRHRLIITGLAPREVGPGTTDLVFTRAEMQFMCQVSLTETVHVYICILLHNECEYTPCIILCSNKSGGMH